MSDCNLTDIGVDTAYEEEIEKLEAENKKLRENCKWLWFMLLDYSDKFLELSCEDKAYVDDITKDL